MKKLIMLVAVAGMLFTTAAPSQAWFGLDSTSAFGNYEGGGSQNVQTSSGGWSSYWGRLFNWGSGMPTVYQ